MEIFETITHKRRCSLISASALPSFVLEQLGILEKRAFDGDLSVPNTNEVGMEKLNVQIHKEMKRKEEKKQEIVPDSEGECFTLCILGNFVCF